MRRCFEVHYTNYGGLMTSNTLLSAGGLAAVVLAHQEGNVTVWVYRSRPLPDSMFPLWNEA